MNARCPDAHLAAAAALAAVAVALYLVAAAGPLAVEVAATLMPFRGGHEPPVWAAPVR
jgi:hypothetical protein